MRRPWHRIAVFTIKTNWTLSLFIGKCWRFGAGNLSCVPLFPWLCLRPLCQRVKERSQTIYVCVSLWLCPREKRERECAGMCEGIFCDWACVHMLGQRKDSHIFWSSIHMQPPPSSLSATSALSINRDRERLAVPLLASDLQASLFPESTPQMREPTRSH